MSKTDVKAREVEAAAAKTRFMDTLHTLQHRLSPKTIAADVKDKAREKADGAVSAAKDGMVQAATHPSTIAAITIPIVIYLFRKPIARGMNALLGSSEEQEEPALQPYEAARHPQPLPVAPIAAVQKIPENQGA